MDRPGTSSRDWRVSFTVSDGNMHSAEVASDLAILGVIISNIMEHQA